MADNTVFQTTLATPPSGLRVALDEVPYSGDADAKVQLMRLVHVSGAEGAKTISEIVDATNGVDVDVTRLPSGTVAGAASLPAGTNNIGDVDVLTLPTGSTAAQTAKTADYDTGAGTDTVQMLGIALPASGGAVAGGTATNPVRVDPTGTTTQPVSAASLPLPTGAATAALQTQPGVDIGDVTINNAAGASAVNVQDGGNSLTVDGSVSVSGAVDTELTTADLDTGVGTDTRAVVGLVLAASGGGLLVGSANPLPVSDNGGSLTVDGTVTANAGTGFPPVVTDGAAAGTTGVHVLGTDGTNAQILKTDAAGEAQVDVLTLPALVAGSAKIGAVDTDADATIAAAVPTVGLFMAGTDGTNARGLKTDAAGELQIDVLTLPAVDTELPAAAALTDNMANPTAPAVAAHEMVWDGTAWDRLPGDATNGAKVQIIPALPAGDNNIGNVDIVSGPTGASALQQQGTAAHDAAAVGNPLLLGAQMETMADSAPGTRSGTDGDATKLATTDGAAYVIPTGPQIFTFHATGVQTGAQVHAAPGVGLACYVTAISFSIGAATASSVKVLNNLGADIWGPHYVEAINGRGLHVTFPTPLKATANTRLDVTTTGAATQTVDIQGFIAPG